MEEVKVAFIRRPAVVNVMLVLAGIAAVFIAGAIPSAASVGLLCINPNYKLWSLLETTAYCIFSIVNILIWVRFVLKYHNVKRFLIINGIVYIFYALFSTVLLRVGATDFIMYSLLFTHMRWPEVLGLNTKYSVIVSNLVMFVLMGVSLYFANRYSEKILAFIKASRGDAAEIEAEDVTPTQHDSEVRILSAEEIDENMQKDREEAADVLKSIIESMPDKVWDDGIVKGRGEAVVHVDTKNPDNDLTAGDFHYIEQVKLEMSGSMNYTGESLWNSGIYKGRDENNIPDRVIDFDNTVTMQRTEGVPDNTSDSLWDAVTQGREGGAPKKNTPPEQEQGVNPNGDYEPDRLWDTVTQGRAGSAPKKNRSPEQEQSTNPNEGYDAQRLWNEIRQGKA